MQDPLTNSLNVGQNTITTRMHGDKEPIPLLYTWTVGFLSVILNLFFRKIETRGSWNIPQHGPVIFVAAPHANQVSQFSLHNVWQAHHI